MKNVLLGIFSLLIMYSCNQQDEHYKYSVKPVQTAKLNLNELILVLDKTESFITEKDFCQIVNYSKSQIVDTLHVGKKKTNVYCSISGDEKKKTVIYYTDDSVKIIAVNYKGIDNTELYVLRNKSHRQLIVALLKDGNFILNRLSEKDIPIRPVDNTQLPE